MLDEYTIKPITEVSESDCTSTDAQFPIDLVAPVVGMSHTFIRKVVGRRSELSEHEVRLLLDQDAFAETFVPRSKVLQYLRTEVGTQDLERSFAPNTLIVGDAVDLIRSLAPKSVACVVTSTPYWAMRVYDTITTRKWADGEVCAYGLEQTPEGFIRHSVEILNYLRMKMRGDGSIWWNVMDSYNTRTQIRANAAEALRAMQGEDHKRWSDHKFRRYSAGHSYLEDGEQCLIPQRIAERASRIGFYVKSVISWCKTATTPEPQNSRVSRNVEYVLHLSVSRTPKFDKAAYLTLPPSIGGRQQFESEKLSDSWYLPTSSGRDGHGAQFPLQLPGRCIALSTEPGDLVLDPFMGAGTTAMAAARLDRHYVGFDISEQYLEVASQRLAQLTLNCQLF